MNNKDEIKTIKYIKWTKYTALAYLLFCSFSIVLFLIHDYQYSTFHNVKLFELATLSLSLWLFNPMVLIVSILGVLKYLKERRDIRKKNQIGKKWKAFIFWNVSTAIVWTISTICFVYITGGV